MTIRDFNARMISSILHPLLMPIYSLVAIGYFKLDRLSNSNHIPRALPMVLIFTVLIPVASLFVLKFSRLISSITLNDRKDRKYPLLLAGLSNIFLGLLFHRQGLAQGLTVLIMGSAALIFIAWLITFYWKISIHMASFGGWAGMVIVGVSMEELPLASYLLLMAVLGILLGWARIERKAHNLPQVVLGFFLGFVIIGLSLLAFLRTA